MASSPVIEKLNELLTIELTVVNQYFAHAKFCEHWGFAALAAKLRDTSFDEMRDAEAIMDRVLLLGGLPNVQRMNAVRLGQSIPEILTIHTEAERDALRCLQEGVEVSLAAGDGASREFFASRLLEEEQHLDWLETQIQLIERVGEANYLAQQIRG